MRTSEDPRGVDRGEGEREEGTWFVEVCQQSSKFRGKKWRWRRRGREGGGVGP